MCVGLACHAVEYRKRSSLILVFYLAGVRCPLFSVCFILFVVEKTEVQPISRTPATSPRIGVVAESPMKNSIYEAIHEVSFGLHGDGRGLWPSFDAFRLEAASLIDTVREPVVVCRRCSD